LNASIVFIFIFYKKIIIQCLERTWLVDRPTVERKLNLIHPLFFSFLFLPALFSLREVSQHTSQLQQVIESDSRNASLSLSNLNNSNYTHFLNSAAIMPDAAPHAVDDLYFVWLRRYCSSLSNFFPFIFSNYVFISSINQT